MTGKVLRYALDDRGKGPYLTKELLARIQKVFSAFLMSNEALPVILLNQ